jgi:hypothetical protein
MRIHDLGPRPETFYPAAKHTPWDADYRTRGSAELERPYIEDTPLQRPGWEAESRWGGRPVREAERDPTRGRTTARGILELGWRRIRNAVRRRGNS